MSATERDRKLAAEVVERVGDRAEATVVVTGGPSGLTRFANSFIHQNVTDDARAVSLTVTRDGRSASSSTTRVDTEALDDLVEATLSMAKLRPADPLWPGLAEPVPVPAVDHFDDATDQASPADRAAIVSAFVAAGDGLRAAGYCDTETTRIAFANSTGHQASGAVTRAVVDGIHQTPTSAGKAHQAALRITDLDGGAMGERAAAKARAGLDAIDLKPGRYEVILEPNAVGTIVSFLSFYGFNGRAANENRSFVALGDQQFDSRISLADDPLDPRAVGFGFDLEGTPRRRLPLIEAGVSKAVAYDRRSAKEAATESTGHGFGPAFYGAGPLPINLFLETGDRTVEEMIASVDRGLLVTEFNYCRVLDPRSVGVTGLTRNGTFLIENGTVSHAVTNLRFTQSFVEALGPDRVLGIESEARLADSEFGPLFAHAPALHLAEWNFTGGAAG
jgi:predicted Zn-dependent protease